MGRRAGEDTYRPEDKSWSLYGVEPEANGGCHAWSGWYFPTSASWQPDAQQRSTPAEEDEGERLRSLRSGIKCCYNNRHDWRWRLTLLYLQYIYAYRKIIPVKMAFVRFFEGAGSNNKFGGQPLLRIATCNELLNSSQSWKCALISGSV